MNHDMLGPESRKTTGRKPHGNGVYNPITKRREKNISSILQLGQHSN
jgi:hypothetical protein